MFISVAYSAKIATCCWPDDRQLTNSSC